MRWTFWKRRQKKDAATSGTQTPVSRPMYVPGRESVMTGESHYVLPNDLHETNRLELQHVAMLEQFGTNIFAPIQDPKHILDVASGTGRWAKEVGAQFPIAQIVGIDVSVPLEIQEKGPASEYTFQQANVLNPLPFPDGYFDYVHMRFVFSAIPALKWPEVIRELVRVTAPNGWVELVEAYTPIEGGPALAQIEAWATQLLAARGIDITYGRHVATLLRDAGLTSISERSASLPMGPYGGKVGQIIGLDMFTAFRSATPAYVQALGIERNTVQDTIDQADADVYDNKYQAIFPIYIAFGQRPG